MEPEPTQPHTTSRVVFKNQPRFLSHEVQRESNKRRQNIVAHLDGFFASHELFAGKEISVEFSHEGISSLVCFFEVGDTKYVLKVPLGVKSPEGEGMFLKAWESAGVKVPHVFDEGKIAGHPYLIMEYVDAPLLYKIPKTEGEGESFELGKILHTMHRPEAPGYGFIFEGKTHYKSFKDWVESEDLQKRIRYVTEQKLLTDEHGSLSQAISVLNEYCQKENKSSYCHFDFGSGNILATKPFTVIDPNPMCNNGVIDLGRSMVLAISGGHTSASEEFLKGYCSLGFSVPPEVLRASILLNVYMKFYYWHKVDKTSHIKRVQEYLLQK